jgi:hypothetical protein
MQLLCCLYKLLPHTRQCLAGRFQLLLSLLPCWCSALARPPSHQCGSGCERREGRPWVVYKLLINAFGGEIRSFHSTFTFGTPPRPSSPSLTGVGQSTCSSLASFYLGIGAGWAKPVGGLEGSIMCYSSGGDVTAGSTAAGKALGVLQQPRSSVTRGSAAVGKGPRKCGAGR